MDILSLIVVIIAGAVILAVFRNLWIVLAMRVFGWKPRILDEKTMVLTVKECAARFFQKCKHLREEQVECMSDDEKRMMQEDMEIYSRFVIESYVQNYLMAK